VSAISRATQGVRVVVSDPVERRAYIGRLKWLLNGSGTMQANSLEYRAGLTGRYESGAARFVPDEEVVMRCPDGCGAHAPLSHLYERRFVYRLDSTVASTVSGASLLRTSTEPPFFIRESISWPFESILTHGLDIPEVKQAEAGPEGTCVVFPTTPNYYHWLIEELPLVLRAVEVAPTATYLAFGEGITDKHRIAAEHLGIELTPMPVVVSMAEQILPGRANDSWFVHPADARRLRDFGASIAGDSRADAAERIYVSRRFSRRALPDEERIEQLLESQGFRILHLESLGWREQIAAFRAARVIVAPHGAGLSNLVFTAPGATVVEIINAAVYNRCFEWICHVSGHAYRTVDSDLFPQADDMYLLVGAITEEVE
jgi:hypothetical protein